MSIQVTLKDVLNNREKRQARQRVFLARHKLPLVSLSVNMPGAYKLTYASENIFDTLHKALEEGLKKENVVIKEVFTCKELTGPESLMAVNMEAEALKAFTCKLESSHPLGRFIDMDVLDREGKILSRSLLGLPRRKCYLCDEDAVLCARSRNHDLQELTDFIERSVQEFCDES